MNKTQNKTLWLSLAILALAAGSWSLLPHKSPKPNERAAVAGSAPDATDHPKIATGPATRPTADGEAPPGRGGSQQLRPKRPAPATPVTPVPAVAAAEPGPSRLVRRDDDEIEAEAEAVDEEIDRGDYVRRANEGTLSDEDTAAFKALLRRRNAVHIEKAQRLLAEIEAEDRR